MSNFYIDRLGRIYIMFSDKSKYVEYGQNLVKNDKIWEHKMCIHDRLHCSDKQSQNISGSTQ